jgi:hypothetical protein
MGASKTYTTTNKQASKQTKNKKKQTNKQGVQTKHSWQRGPTPLSAWKAL